jgi:bifunctional DNA-binding transcriptional regulator/antitoxin component of YhaV-PrlF toxin-antitoxin module
MARTVVVQKTGEIRLPREALEKSHIATGKELVVVARAGQILLLDRQQLRRRMKDIDRRQQERLRQALGQEGQDSFFASLSFAHSNGFCGEQKDEKRRGDGRAKICHTVE